MPERMTQLRKALGLKGGKPNFKSLQKWGSVKPGTPVAEIPALFPRIQPPGSPEGGPEPAGKPGAPTGAKKSAAESAPGEGLISIQDFSRVQLRTAKVIEAEKVPGSEKLLRLVVLMGSERRQVVAGIALYYDPAKLIGRTIVMVANLKPATIHGVESQGMLLAASKGESLRLVSVDGEIASGAVVK
jgi:methionyl-tRNA synthetase